jgi:hypothetical protein
VFTKNNLHTLFRLTTIILTLLVGLLCSEASFADAGYTEQGNALTKALKEDLIQQGICSLDTRLPTCDLQMYRADGKRIHLNMYGQTDTILASKVAAFLVEKGLKISRGMPITLKVFSAPKSKYLGLKSIFSKNDELLKLELNK